MVVLATGPRYVPEARQALSNTRCVAERGRKESGRMSARIPTNRLPDVESRRPAIFGIGFGGLAVLIGGTYVVWRILRGGGSNTGTSWTSYTSD